MMEICLGDYILNEESEPYFIAEIGINHNGDLQIAKKLVDGAYAAGWNAVKFQKREPDIAVPEHQKGVMRDTPWGRMTYLEYKKRVEFGKTEYDYIDHYCREKPLDWSASPWDMPSLEFLLTYDIPFIKIASASITQDGLLKAVAKSGKPVIMSTGMSTWEELDHAVNILEQHCQNGYVLMHTNSTYPAPENELNLSMIQTLKDRYHCIVGYSGHERALEPTVVALVLGAQVIERHITLDHEMWGTDQAASLTLHAMDMLRRRAKGLRAMIGNGERMLSESELNVRKKLRG
ncbi:N-acetylneuraminate synthase family protein [Selenomonas timonae]|uniref:N-acetylneuraminate synthase family protein n=1 Tax=Selenomonas timonae TaxID=2754044 RepID=A0A7G7VH60_9FIRM|nr:N-acetylneuraminate synthase family protein [Selenomonas timonae]QNH53453.1 N-acetylneuraminate synthase family protein [Selenomonas timonae]